MKTKLAIIGASELQNPLILKAKEMGCETHVFAWKAGDVGEETADFFYPISITEKEEILAKCREIGIDGITTIGSDLATVAVCFVADALGLPGNSLKCNLVSTNKHEMRRCFEENGDPSPKSIMVESIQDLEGVSLDYPVIVKPLDRSGSRGITKVESWSGLESAIEAAKETGFDKHALVEEFAEGEEFSVEFISFEGTHHFLAMTKKYTTGAPHFIETGHMEPAEVSEETLNRVIEVINHALTSLKITTGASHSEVKIDEAGNIRIIEIGARMGGDFIGSDLVFLSTGMDFLQGVVNCALVKPPVFPKIRQKRVAAVSYILNQQDIQRYQRLCQTHPEFIVSADVPDTVSGEVSDSSTRFGYFIMASERKEDLEEYLPQIL